MSNKKDSLSKTLEVLYSRERDPLILQNMLDEVLEETKDLKIAVSDWIDNVWGEPTDQQWGELKDLIK